jgi:hypothetical protein
MYNTIFVNFGLLILSRKLMAWIVPKVQRSQSDNWYRVGTNRNTQTAVRYSQRQPLEAMFSCGVALSMSLLDAADDGHPPSPPPPKKKVGTETGLV